MWKTSVDKGSLSLTAAMSLALWSAQASPQAPASAPRDSLEEVIVTGSFIRGTPEDTAIPVEVITLEDMRDLGRPSNLDLVKLMSEVGQVAGEADRGNAFPIGAATVNLRNLGSRFTTVLFNGRRFPEQFSPVTGRFNNIAWIPNAAIGRVEVLKEGGAVIYGADSIAGVVNYMTRAGFDGVEFNADYRYIEDSDGDYGADALWGMPTENGSILVSVAHQHRSAVLARDRSWTRREYLENPDNWSSSGSPGAYLLQGAILVGSTRTFFPITPLGATTLSRYTGNRQMSVTGIVRDPQCTDLGGFPGWSSTPSPVCYFRTNQYTNVVEESDSYQFYAELNRDLTDSLKLHTEALYYQLDLPDIPTAPSDLPLSWPLVPGTTGRQLAGTTPAYFAAGTNPAVAQFLSTVTSSTGTPAFTAAQVASITSLGRAAMVFGTWRPFGAGGNPTFGEHDVQRNNTKLWRVTTQLSGDLPSFLGTELSWDIGLTYNRVVDRREARDVLADRLQAALNGFGGPGCTGSTPGANGCQYLNPFSSAIERNLYTGQANPGFIGSGTYAGYLPGQGLRNDPALVSWLYQPIWLERTYDYAVFDPLIRGDTAWSLPGGTVAIAFGGQFRWARERTELDDLSNRGLNPCPTIGFTPCNEDARTGVFAFTRPTTVMGATQESNRRFPVAAGFVEAQLPLLETLDLQLASRYERFYSDVTEKDNSIFVPAGSLKWQALPSLALRASGGKTFTQVNPPKDDGPVVAISLPNSDFGNIGGSQSSFTTANYDNVDVKSERGTYFGVGMLLQAGNFSSTVDYFDVRITDFARTLTVNGVVGALVVPGEPHAVNTLINCSSALLDPQSGLDGRAFAELNGPCIQGESRLDSLSGGPAQAGGLPGGRINYFGGTRETNAGELKTSGIDMTAQYRFDDIFGGALTPSLDLSYVLEWELGDHVVAGVPISPGYDAVGFRNENTGRIGQAVPEWRASFGLNYRRGGHTLNLIARYIPSIRDEDADQFEAVNTHNANAGDATGATTSGTGAATVCTTATPPTSDLGDTPAGAGSGLFGGGSVGLSGIIGAGTRGFCGTHNTRVLSGQKIEGTLNLDLTYRVELPLETSLSLSIYNLLNEEPSFARDSATYHSGFGSPLERNFKMTVSKKF